MIPLKISIHNFLSYGPVVQTIDFTHYKLICLSGKNGHGKSALLDAITWALWGQARKVSANTKPDHGLLKIGQTDMSVALDFIFNNQKYRVKRLFSTKHGKHASYLDFGTYDAISDQYKTLSEKTVRKTQEKIEQIIGLDYESFINSSFLRQGQANEFSKKMPKERKDILATILGLHTYEKTKKYALEKIKIITQEKENLSKMSEHLLKELEHAPLISEHLLKNTAHIQDLEQNEKTLHNRQQELEKTRAELYKKELAYNHVQKEYDVLINEKTTKERLFSSLVATWKTIHKKHISLPHKKETLEKKQAITKQLETSQNLFQNVLEQKEKYLHYKMQKQELINTLQISHKKNLYEKHIALERIIGHEKNILKEELELKKLKKTLNLQITTIKKEIANLGNSVDTSLLINDTKTLEKLFERQKKFYLTWAQQGKLATQTLQNIKQKQSLTEVLEIPSCPLCEQNLSLARKRLLYKKFEDEEFFLMHHIAHIKKNLEIVKHMIEEQKKVIESSKKIDTLLQQQTDCTEKLCALDEQLKSLAAQLCENQKAKSECEQAILIFEKNIEIDIASHTEIIRLKNLELACEAIITQHESLANTIQADKETLGRLNDILDQWNMLEQEQAEQQARKLEMSALTKTIRNLTKTLLKIKKRLTTFDTLPEDLKKQACIEREHAKLAQDHSKAKELALHNQGRLQAEQKKLHEQMLYQKNCLEKIVLLQQEIHEYQVIAQAFGKDGIQALLIEDALPEIEYEANDLLSRLTDNQAHIFIESLRDLKKGGVKETLDINISDANGIRPYELFSGGEAFRIDFSLRIAISKLLAKRSGTSLQTLIIDEGFGSQDEEGLTKIMDALYKIQNDFEKIIIVSHLSTMKDQFPVHFIIEKNPQGSRVMIKELG